MSKSVLHVWLPTKKIYPLGPVTLANHIHMKKPKVLQHILDLSLVAPSERDIVLHSTVRGFDPDMICFSWRDIQIYAPHQDDPSLDFALNFFVFSNPFKWVKASFQALFALAKYNSRIKENLKYINDTAQQFPQKQILLGGGAFSVFYNKLIDMLNENVLGVIGEGEPIVIKLLEDRSIENERHASRSHLPITSSLDVTSSASIFDNVIDVQYISSIFRQHKEYFNTTIGIETKRGCPYSCQFCVYPHIEGKNVRIIDPQAVIKTMRSYNKHCGIKSFWFADAQFIPGRSFITHAENILEGIMVENLGIEWSAYIRTSLVTHKLARLMVNTGLSNLEVSITSGSQKIIDGLQLGFTLEEIYRGCSYLKEAGYKRKLILNYSLNSPGADIDSLRESIKSYKKIVKIMGEDYVIPFIFFLGIQPNTIMEKNLLKSGYLQDGYNPISLSPQNASKLLYNPPPLNKILAKAYGSTTNLPAEEKGKAVFRYLEENIM